MRLTLHVWRQSGPAAVGRFVEYAVDDLNPDMSFVEMLDVLNQRLLAHREDPIAFDSDCREGICGACGVVINGEAHGPVRGTATCQLHLRHFGDGDVVWLEPWRAAAFTVLKDLVVDRGALDRVIAAGGFIAARTGGAPDANTLPVAKDIAEDAMDAAACIGCGACVAACPNASASLFTAAKITHLASLPQGEPERHRRVLAMVAQMDIERFGACTWHGECEAACPKGISIHVIARMYREYLAARATYRPRRETPTGE